MMDALMPTPPRGLTAFPMPPTSRDPTLGHESHHRRGCRSASNSRSAGPSIRLGLSRARQRAGWMVWLDGGLQQRSSCPKQRGLYPVRQLDASKPFRRIEVVLPALIDDPNVTLPLRVLI